MMFFFFAKENIYLFVMEIRILFLMQKCNRKNLNIIFNELNKERVYFCFTLNIHYFFNQSKKKMFKKGMSFCMSHFLKLPRKKFYGYLHHKTEK